MSKSIGDIEKWIEDVIKNLLEEKKERAEIKIKWASNDF